MNKKNEPQCVLIVDDDYYFSTDVLGYHLKRRGFNVINAYTASGFEKNWQSSDVIVLDIRLPEKEGDPIDPWGGLKALKRIQENNPDERCYPQLKNCIIRSAQTQADASGAKIDVPQHHRWYPPDIPFSDIIKTVKEVAEENMKMRDRDEKQK
jgi:CheY-like chemotaxis protein